MQLQKLIRKEFEELLKKNNMNFEVLKDKKNTYFQINLIPDHLLLNQEKCLSIEIYKKYLVLTIAGWKYFEKIDSVEAIEALKSLQMIDKFFHQEMKIKVFSSHQHPFKWKIYLFKKNYWELYRESRLFFKTLFSFKKPEIFEISIAHLQKNCEGVLSCYK